MNRRSRGCRVRGAAVLGAAVLSAVLSADVLGAQGRFTNTRTETRSAAQGLEREVRALASRGGVTWVGYHVPMVSGPRQMCCYDNISSSGDSCCGVCRLESGSGVSMNTGDSISRNGSRIALESATEFLVLARLENGQVSRVRTFTPDCDVDGGGMAVVWLSDVKPDESIAWLSSLVLAVADSPGASGASGDSVQKDRVAKTAMSAIALHNVPAADRALESFVAPSRPEWLRGDTAFWLGSTRGDAGAGLLARMIASDPSEKVRDKVTFGLSVSKTPAALTTLLNTAKNDQSRKVRGQALFWLAQRAGREALAAIAGAIDNDPDTEVKKKAVFALSQMPADEGVPRLIEIARSHRNPEVRKQAIFWLGQSNDPRAVKFFEDILFEEVGMIEIVSYDPQWPRAFEIERDRIQAALGSLARRIEHNGSTAVPGLAAKPVIDIQISVARLQPLDAFGASLASLGYVHVPTEDDSRCPFFHRPRDWPHTHHVHVVEAGGLEERRTLAFRDYLRANPAAAREYEALKRGLAAHGGADAESREAYAIAKTAFIERIIAVALREEFHRS